MIFAGVRIVTLAEGEIGELHVGLKGTMNALFLKDLADKTRRGLRSGREGSVRRRPVLRLHGEARVASDGSPIRGGRVIDETEAAIVRQISSTLPPAKARARSPLTSMSAASRSPIARGVPPPSTATAPAAPASSTTSSIAAAWYGTACAT